MSNKNKDAAEDAAQFDNSTDEFEKQDLNFSKFIVNEPVIGQLVKVTDHENHMGQFSSASIVDDFGEIKTYALPAVLKTHIKNTELGKTIKIVFKGKIQHPKQPGKTVNDFDYFIKK